MIYDNVPEWIRNDAEWSARWTAAEGDTEQQERLLDHAARCEDADDWIDLDD